MSAVQDPTGLQITIPQSSQSSSNLMSSILDSCINSDQDSWMESGTSCGGLAEETEEEQTEEQQISNNQIISTVRVKFVQ